MGPQHPPDSLSSPREPIATLPDTASVASIATTASVDALHPDETLAALRTAGSHPLLNAFPDGSVFAFDPDLRFLCAGGRGLAQTGLSREQLEGHTVFEVFPPETSALLAPHYRAAVQGRSTRLDVPYQGRLYSLLLAPVTGRDGSVVAGIGLTHDVTDARAAETARRESEERNRLTFENAPIGQAIVEIDGSWRQVNAAVTQLTGYSEQELLSLTFQDITHPEDLDLDLGLLERLLAGEIGTYQIEKRYVTATRRIVWVLLSVALVRAEDDTPLYFVSQLQDITDQKRQQQLLRDLTAMLAHDLRTPATVLRGFSELLAGPAAEDPGTVRDYAARIASAADTMTDLLDNALTASTLDSGGLDPSPRPVPLAETVRSVIDHLGQDHARIETAIPADLCAWVDPMHVQQIVSNLLTNSAKYGGDRVTITAEPVRDAVRITVADDGPGVEKNFVPHLFDRFSRAARDRSGSQRGSGLGLYIVRDLVRANGGSIRYLSEQPTGATFEIVLPTGPAETAGPAAALPVGD